MSAVKLFTEYETLLEVLNTKKEKFFEDKISIFNYAKGEMYNKDLLIIGRAVNGWNTLDKHNLENAIEEVSTNLQADNLQWVIDSWGINDGNYNTAKSAFWRVSKMIAQQLIGDKEDIINYLAWTNLYKVSKHDKGNPSGSLMNIQFDQCKRIIELEIELLQPKVIVFLTSHGWAKWFLQEYDYKPLNIDLKFSFVDNIGRMGNSIVVVGQHPQGKAETPHCEEILTAIRIAKTSQLD